MREIKFRGRRVDNGEFIYGDLLTGDGDFAIISDTWRACVEPDSVEQLIGHDSNGVEIYEGDIYFDGDTQTQTHAPCIDDLVNEALGDNFVSLNYHEMERAKKTLVEATS